MGCSVRSCLSTAVLKPNFGEGLCLICCLEFLSMRSSPDLSRQQGETQRLDHSQAVRQTRDFITRRARGGLAVVAEKFLTLSGGVLDADGAGTDRSVRASSSAPDPGAPREKAYRKFFLRYYGNPHSVKRTRTRRRQRRRSNAHATAESIPPRGARRRTRATLRRLRRCGVR